MRLFINIKIAFKSILNSKVQSLVSILGLSIGLGSIILILMLYMHENSFDRYIPQNDQVYRVIHGTRSAMPFILGETAESRNEVAISETMARKYFPNGDAMNKTLEARLSRVSKGEYHQ